MRDGAGQPPRRRPTLFADRPGLLRVAFYRLPNVLKTPLLKVRRLIRQTVEGGLNPANNIRAFNDLMRHGSACGNRPGPMLACLGDDRLPPVDISAVTYNSQKWLSAFGAALKALDYPRSKLRVCFVDNGSSDETPSGLLAIIDELAEAGIEARLIEQENVGFGGGHNVGIASTVSAFVLVTNVDVTFEPDALRRIVSHAVADSAEAAAWEMRQKPYEHPKVYEPLTGTTNWNSHACVLLRRSAFESVGGYSDDLFLYGEDVELSYRLRSRGFALRYNPHAVVYHHTYETAGALKPLQYTGSTFANLYIRLRYGGLVDMLLVGPLALWLLVQRPRFAGARSQQIRNIGKLVAKAPKIVRRNLSMRTSARFPFRYFDYDLSRCGAFHDAGLLPAELPKVSVITRSYRGREALLRQAMISVANQTYPNIEHLVAEDRDEGLAETIRDFAHASGRTVIHVTGNRVGRSDAGNLALAQATGQYCMFLDDDDQLYGDHVETLVAAVLANQGARAAYSLAFDLPSKRHSGKEADFEVGLPISHRFMQTKLDAEAMTVRNYLPIQAMLFERSLFTERGGFEEDLDVLEDWALWQKYTHKTACAYVPKTTSFYRTPLEANAQAERMELINVSYDLVRKRMDAWRAAWDGNAAAGAPQDRARP